jgi:DNA gyrase/topoisomerase IV subunit B
MFSGCTLILTEGDSAKTLAVAGLGVIGRDYYGVYPLKGIFVTNMVMFSQIFGTVQCTI